MLRCVAGKKPAREAPCRSSDSGVVLHARRCRLRGTAVPLGRPKEMTRPMVCLATLVSMSARARWRPLPFDVLVATALLFLGQLQISSPDPHRVIANPWFSSVVWALTCAALVWRRRAPWLTFTLVVVGLTVEALPAPDSGTFAGFIALCVVLYTVARTDPRLETTVAASAIALLALFFHYTRDPQASNAVESIQATYVVLLACAVAGRMLAARAAQGAAMQSELAAQHAQRAEAAAAAAVAERARIARELHDVIGHGVSVTIVQSMAAQSDIGDGQLENASRRVAVIEESARQVLAEMRRLVAIDDTHTATPPEAQPRMCNLPALVERFRAAGARVKLDQQGPWTDIPLGAELALFRITQEALTNALTHAPGARINVRVTHENGSIESDVINGPATGPDAGPGSGRGLLGMRERVNLYGGTLHAGPSPDGGYQVRAILPVGSTSR